MFRWLGVAGIAFEENGRVLAVDPFLSRPPIWRLGIGRPRPDAGLISKRIERCDFILVTHAHWDHLMDVPEVIRQTGAAAFGSRNTCELLTAAGIQPETITEIAAGEKRDLGPFRVEAIHGEHAPIPFFGPGRLQRSLHAPFHLHDFRMDTCLSFLIATGGIRYLDWAGVSPDGAPRADVLFIGAYFSQPTLKTIVSRVQPQIVVPIHWDDFFRPLSRPIRPSFQPPRLAFPPLKKIDLRRFKMTIQEVDPKCRVLVPEVFVPYDVDLSRREQSTTSTFPRAENPNPTSRPSGKR